MQTEVYFLLEIFAQEAIEHILEEFPERPKVQNACHLLMVY